MFRTESRGRQVKRVQPGNANNSCLCRQRPQFNGLHHEQKNLHRHGQRRDHHQILRGLGKRRARLQQSFAALRPIPKTAAARSSPRGSRASAIFSRRIICNGRRSRAWVWRFPGLTNATAFSARRRTCPPAFPAGMSITDYSAALEKQAGRPLPLVVGNDGNLRRRGRGAARARQHQGHRHDAHARLRPRRGVRRRGRSAARRRHARRHGSRPHAAAAVHLLGLNRQAVHLRLRTRLGLRRSLHDHFRLCRNCSRKKSKIIPTTNSPTPPRRIKEKVFSLRTRAQKGDALALEIFDFQARVMGLHVANLVMALDPGIVVIGGGLMDHEATTPEFRERYMRIIRETATPYLWPPQRGTDQDCSGRTGRTLPSHRRGARGDVSQPEAVRSSADFYGLNLRMMG